MCLALSMCAFLHLSPSYFLAKDVVVDLCLRLGIRANYTCFRRVNERMSLLSAKNLSIGSDPTAQSTLLPDVWRDGPVARSRSRILSAVLSNFQDQSKFKIKSSVLQEALAEQADQYRALDDLLEAHGPFSLVDTDVVVTESEPDSIEYFSQLLHLIKAERQIVCQRLDAKGVEQLGNDSCSDASLVQTYLTSIVQPIHERIRRRQNRLNQ